MPLRTDVAIVGGGLAAIRTAQGLRDHGFDGTITVISEEAEPPYDRPPLSKDFLHGRSSAEDIRLLSAGDYEDLALDLMLDSRAAALDAGGRRVVVAGGEEIGYGRAVIATGAHPHRIAGLDGYDNVLYLRTLDDAQRLRETLRHRPRMGIVGGGFIGLEVAAVASELACPVTIVEGEATPLATALGAELGGCIQAWHEEHGVRFRCGSLVRRAHGGSSVEELELADGSRLPVDVVVVGIGVAPAVEWLHGSGIELHRGLMCDAVGRSSHPEVFGVGDGVCRHLAGRCQTSGHWTGATEQAQVVAAAMLGVDAKRTVREGYFWSDQYDVRLQFTGSAPPGAQITVTSGSIAERRFVALCRAGDRVTGVFAMGSPREFVRTTLDLRAAQPAGAMA